MIFIGQGNEPVKQPSDLFFDPCIKNAVISFFRKEDDGAVYVHRMHATCLFGVSKNVLLF